jgi:hypothetical protein
VATTTATAASDDDVTVCGASKPAFAGASNGFCGASNGDAFCGASKPKPTDCPTIAADDAFSRGAGADVASAAGVTGVAGVAGVERFMNDVIEEEEDDDDDDGDDDDGDVDGDGEGWGVRLNDIAVGDGRRDIGDGSRAFVDAISASSSDSGSSCTRTVPGDEVVNETSSPSSPRCSLLYSSA